MLLPPGNYVTSIKIILLRFHNKRIFQKNKLGTKWQTVEKCLKKQSLKQKL
jgi:hypothetical protein